LFGPLYAAFVDEIGGGLAVAGASYAVFTIVTGVFVFFISRWEDHVKHQERLIIVGRGMAAIAFFGYLLIKTPVHLFIVQGFLGIALAISSPAMQSVYSKHLDKGKFASQWGLWESLVSIIAGLAAIAGGFLAEAYGFRVLFWLMFIFSVFAFLYSFKLLKKENGRKKVGNGRGRMVPSKRAGKFH